MTWVIVALIILWSFFCGFVAGRIQKKNSTEELMAAIKACGTTYTIPAKPRNSGVGQ